MMGSSHNRAFALTWMLVLGLAGTSAHAEVVWRESIAHPFDNFGFGNEANANSSAGSTLGSCSRIASDDGRYVVFVSDASNLVRGDTNNLESGHVESGRAAYGRSPCPGSRLSRKVFPGTCSMVFYTLDHTEPPARTQR